MNDNLNFEPTILVFVADSGLVAPIKEQLFKVVTKMQAGDKIYFTDCSQVDPMRHPGQVNAHIANRKRFKAENIKESLREATVIMSAEDRISHRYIVVLADSDYRGMLSSGLAVALRMSQREYMDCHFIVCMLGTDTIKIEGEWLRFIRIEDTTTMGEQLMDICFEKEDRWQT